MSHSLSSSMIRVNINFGFHVSFVGMVALVVGTKKEKIEIIKENFETELCNNIQKYPLYVGYQAGSTWNDGKITICGGWIQLWNGSIHDSDECYSLENGYWKLNSQKLQTGRSSLAASHIGHSIWITGNKIQVSQ